MAVLARACVLEGNNLGPHGSHAMGPALTSPDLMLTKLDISDCNLGVQGVGI